MMNRLLALVLVLMMCLFALPVAYADGSENQVVTVEYAPDVDLPDHEELFAMYAEGQFSGGGMAAYSTGGRSAGAQLTGDIKKAYDALVPIIRKIAAGERSATTITVGSGSGVDVQVNFEQDFNTYFNFKLLIKALLSDLPYELYWYKKDVTMKLTGSLGSGNVPVQLIFPFPVVGAYAAAGEYTVDTTKTGAAAAAAANAVDVVDANADKSDYEKLVAYRNYICGAVSYNDEAINDANNTPYGDPWQLIYVFDGNENTNVVCEGYAKAFQYLCDMTAFDSKEISCYTVSGRMNGGTGAGGHMWNIVTMDDGKNYLVDVTNCDSGTIGYSDGLFLKGYDRTVTYSYTDGTTQDAYRFDFNSSSVDFLYDLDLPWGNSILTISATDYTPGEVHSCEYSWKDGNAKTATAHTLTCSCGESKEENHTLASAANCQEAAKCSICGTYGEKNAANHAGTTFTYAVNGSKHDKKYVCCGVLAAKEDHTWTYEAQDSTLTQKCQYCPAIGSTLTISAPADLIYDGTAKEVEATGGINGIYVLTEYEGSLTDGKPVNAGTYTASVTLDGQTASVQYTIAPKPVTVTAQDQTVSVGTAIAQTLYAAEGLVSGHQLTAELSANTAQVTDNGTIMISNVVIKSGDADVTANYDVTTVSGKLVVTTHEHNWDYSVNGNVITATCSGEGVCGVAEKKATVTLTGGTYTYDGMKKQADVTQNPAGVFGDIAVTYNADPVNAGSYTASIMLGGVTATDTLTIQPKTVTPVVTLSPSTFTYDGTAKEPIVTVTADGVVLGLHEYASQYQENINAGTAKVIVYPASNVNYTFDMTEVSFTIAPAALTDDMVKMSVNSMVYTGSALEPDVTVTGLVKDTDYTVAYSNNVNVGTATVTVTGKGNYAGTVEKTFEISNHGHVWSYSASGNVITATCAGEGVCGANNIVTVTLTGGTYAYDRTKKQATVTQNPAGVFIDVAVTYDYNPVSAGSYTASITLGGVTATDTLTIQPKAVTPTLTVETPTYIYDGTEKMPYVSVKDGDVELDPIEYMVFYEDHVNAGTAKTIVRDAANGNYALTETAAIFTILPATLTDDMVSLSVGSMVYTGSALTPDVTVTGLTKDTDYTVAYSDNVNIGMATVTITGKGNYTGTVEKTFEITTHAHNWDYSVNGSVITAACTGEGVCGASNTATVTLTGGMHTYDGTKKQAAVTQNPAGVFGDIPVTYNDDPVNAGSYTASITLGDVTATDTLTIQPKAVTPAVVLAQTNYIYDGSEKKPAVTVKDGSAVLDASEYTVTYAQNVNAGTATVTVSDAAGGNYALTETAATFTIAAATLTDDVVSLSVSSMVYTGSALEPAVTVTGLTKDTDYTVAYSNNTNVGTATVTVTGKGNYAGTVTKTFEITGHVHTWNYSVSGNVITAECTGEGVCGVAGKKATVTLTGGTYTYDGMKKQAAVTQNPAGTFDDIDVTYSADPVNAGSYTASITLGSATASAAIAIEPKAITADFSAVAASYPYTGSEIKPVVTAADGANAVAQSEYTVTYSNNVNVGKAMITVSSVAGGNYTVSGTKEFDIVKAAAPAVQPCEVAILREIDTTGNAVDLAKLLPENRGATTYAITASSNNAAVKNFAVSEAGKVTFDTAKSDAASEAVYVIKAVMQNYNDAQITVKIILSDKEQVTITGAGAASGLTYDGTAKTGYTGTPSAAPYTGAFDVVYAGTQADGTNYGPAQQAPVNAGSYTVTISVPDSAVYAGSTTLGFEIAKATVTIKASDRTELVGQTMPELSYEVTGLVGSDQLTTAPTITCTPDMNTAGKYPITVSGAQAGANYEIAYQAGTLSVVMGGTESAAAQIVAKELNSVASALLSTPFDTVEKIKAEQARTLIEGNTDYSEENMAHYDVKLQFTLDSGKTWIDASEVNFPVSGLVVRIDYPQGTSKDTHDFIVSHMFTMTSERLGTKAGETEQPAVIELEDALEFTVTGLSPVSIAWKETSEVQETADSLPKTGDVSTIFIWTLLCFAALIGSSLASSRREY